MYHSEQCKDYCPHTKVSNITTIKPTSISTETSTPTSRPTLEKRTTRSKLFQYQNQFLNSFQRQNNKIFVQIPSYRDPELKNTINDAINKAFLPNELVFAICWQHGDDEDLNEYQNDPRFKIIDVPYNKSKGVGWARNEIQKLYTNEQYTLQLDSHHRFVKNWDIILIVMLEELKKKYENPIITSYGASYKVGPPDKFDSDLPCIISSTGFREDGSIILVPHIMMHSEDLDEPIPARFSSAHFMFSDGKICKECPSDPEIYFDGEEINRTVRCYTLGYNMFHPHINIIWHEYMRNYRIKHWDDHKNKDKGLAWYERDQISKKRLRKLLGMEDNDVDLGQFGLGNKRSLQDYEKFANINFKNRTVGVF